jgi:hypothetical protein
MNILDQALLLSNNHKNPILKKAQFNKTHLVRMNQINQILEDVEDILQNNNLPQNMIILNEYLGHTTTLGSKAGQTFNKAYRVYDTDCKQIYIMMYIEPNSYTKLSCETFYDLVSENNIITWYLHPVGYAASTFKIDGVKTYKYLHQYLMQTYQPNNDPNLSVDHINQDKLDNRIENLRWANQSEQNINRGKVSRHQNAQQLPEDIPQILPKYVTFNTEIYNKETGAKRSYFRIEGHPLAPILWSSSKSTKVSNLDKYNETMQRLAEIQNGKIKPDEKYVYPTGIRLDEKNNVFIFDLRYKNTETNTDTRYNLKMRLNMEKSTEENFEDFKIKITTKYTNVQFP